MAGSTIRASAGRSVRARSSINAGRRRTTASPKKGPRPAPGALRKSVLFQKAKRQLLRSGTVGPEQVHKLLAAYLKIVLFLTGTSARSILIPGHDRLVFRASKVLGRSIARDKGVAVRVFSNGRIYRSSDVSGDTRWSGRVGAKPRFAARNSLCAPLQGR